MEEAQEHLRGRVLPLSLRSKIWIRVQADDDRRGLPLQLAQLIAELVTSRRLEHSCIPCSRLSPWRQGHVI